MMRIAFCDDDHTFLEQVKEYIKRYIKETEISVEFSFFEDGDSLLSAIKNHVFDICFLDVLMPLMDGMETARELRRNNNSIKLVFATTSSDFAVDSYEVKAKNYLLKPISYEKFKSVLDDLHTELTKEEQCLVVKTAVGYQKLYHNEIAYLESMNKIVMIYLRNGSLVETKEPLYHLEERLLSDNFFKCHRSYMVNMHHIETFNSSSIIMRSGKQIPIARGYAEELKNAYFRLMFGK